MSVTCPFCKTQVQLIPDGVIRYCQCFLLGVDHTRHDTRYLGSIPIEDPKFESWWHKVCDRLNK